MDVPASVRVGGVASAVPIVVARAQLPIPYTTVVVPLDCTNIEKTRCATSARIRTHTHTHIMVVNHPHARGHGRHTPHASSELRGHMSKFACNGLDKNDRGECSLKLCCLLYVCA